MRFWFSPQSEVPIRRQLVTQVTLAILSGDLRAGERLPSTRALARRYAIHPNTVSAGYQQLEQEGWVESRRGSGVYVRGQAETGGGAAGALEYHIAGFFHAMRGLGLSDADVRARVTQWLATPMPDHFLLIDPDVRLREILLHELRAMASVPVRECAVADCAQTELLAGAMVVCRPSKTAMVRAALPSGTEVLTLPINSATAWLAERLRTADVPLVAVVSHWPEFLELARTMLLAAGLPAEGMMFCDASVAGWRRGLGEAGAIVCDSFTAAQPGLPARAVKLVFPLLADAAREMLTRRAVGL